MKCYSYMQFLTNILKTKINYIKDYTYIEKYCSESHIFSVTYSTYLKIIKIGKKVIFLQFCFSCFLIYLKIDSIFFSYIHQVLHQVFSNI